MVGNDPSPPGGAAGAGRKRSGPPGGGRDRRCSADEEVTMDPLPAELPDGLADHVRLAETLREVRDRIDAVTATAYSPDGLVAATVDGRGELTALDLDPRIYRDQDSAALADAITGTVRAARRDAMRDASRIAALLVTGADPEDVDPQLDPVLAALAGEPERRRAIWRT
jgi:DNA-binding protein YbaB